MSTREKWIEGFFFAVAAIIVIGACFINCGCASGADGLRQGCADANSGLTAGYKVVTGEMKNAEANGTAKKLYTCFEAAVNGLNTLTEAKDSVCCVQKDSNGNCVIPDNLPKQTFSDYAAKAVGIAPQVAPLVANFRACLSTLNGGK